MPGRRWWTWWWGWMRGCGEWEGVDWVMVGVGVGVMADLEVVGAVGEVNLEAVRWWGEGSGVEAGGKGKGGLWGGGLGGGAGDGGEAVTVGVKMVVSGGLGGGGVTEVGLVEEEGWEEEAELAAAGEEVRWWQCHFRNYQYITCSRPMSTKRP
ncbi:hypothetical protein CYMTET_23978 [Cymbomonas tetramitiformis]|uniref:Uncharacterized protein n=1 Tax=Cymbomonas tetramitiformis TaxID=36881 RepID=A0AAE0FXM4_9CHLO|nr:hypothetical protein CYMTET_23978 [Cymbomonas tetramitiformis]